MMGLREISLHKAVVACAAALIALPLSIAEEPRSGPAQTGDPQPQSPPCYITHSEGPCGPTVHEEIRCDNGAGVACTTLEVTSEHHYTAGLAVGNVGYTEVTRRNCSVRTIIRKCYAFLDGRPEECRVYRNVPFWIAGSIATGDSCDSAANRIADR